MSAPVAAPVRPFDFLPGTSPLRPWVAEVLDGLDDRVADLPAGPVQVVAELRCRRAGDRWEPARLYCSLQVPPGGAGDAGGADGAGGRFAAWTLHWSPGEPPRWSRFPADPRLDTLGPALAAHPAAEVLRYVPLRRATFRAGATVVKVKRRSRLADSASRAAAFTAATAGTPVRVPRLRGVDPRLSAYAQEVLPGASLADQAAGPALEPLLAEAGRLHAEVHRLRAPHLPPGATPAALAADVAPAVEWAAACAPEHADLLRRHVRTLARLAPAPAPAVVCHGDLVPSHLLGGPGHWTLIDLDLAHRGDPYRDLGLFLAGLPTDVPALTHDAAPPARRRAAEEAYLTGYRERSGRPLDRRRLAWHRASAELHHVGLMATKDRWSPAGLARATARVGELLEEAS